MKTTEEKMNVLSSIAAQLNGAKITWALGASAMLYFNHIMNEFNDIDIVIDDKDALAAKELLVSMGILTNSEPGGHYGTKHFYHFLIDGVEVDVMGGFAIIQDGIVYDCSLNNSDIVSSRSVNGQMVPLHSVQVWRRYYELMRRSAKVALIDGTLKQD